MEKEQKKTLYKMGLPIILGTILLIGVSYAWLTLTLNGTKTNVLKAGTLSLTLDDASSTGINLASTVPMLDEVGVTTSPYSFTLTNNGDIDSEYTIYLDDVALDDGETRLADTVIKYNLVKDSTSMATALLSTTGTNPNRVLDSGTIKPGETYSYDLRLWIDQDATTTISGQVFKGKIRVEAVQIKETASTPESCFKTEDKSDGTVKVTMYVCAPRVITGVGEGNSTVNTNSINNITDVVMPKTINGKVVSEIANFAFYNNGITSIQINEGVTRISDITFYQNSTLTEVILPSTLTTIGGQAFSDCALSSIQIPNQVTTIDFESFKNNQLTSITIPSSVTTIGESAFAYNQLTSVIIQGKSSTSDFTRYPSDSFFAPFGWASGYSDDNIIWQP